jgi:hypothetical protein
MKKVFGFLIGITLGLISSYCICSLMSSELHPSKWDPGIKALGTFIGMLSAWVFTFDDI